MREVFNAKGSRDIIPGCLTSILLPAILLVALAGPALACPVLLQRPVETLADKLLESELLVLAREDPGRPFHYAAVEILAGNLDSRSIDLFMPSQVRRSLAGDPQAAVLLSRDANTGDWQSLGFATDDYLSAVHSILASSKRWTPGETDNLQRLKFFAGLLGNSDRRLHELAYLEISRAPYGLIREVGAGLPLDSVRSMHANPQYFPWRGLDIILLGLSAEGQDQLRVNEAIQSKQRLASDVHLGAWSTAYIEIHGAAGVDQLRRWYFENTQRLAGELREVSRALAVHASLRPELRNQVVAAYGVMLENYPLTAAGITHDLIAWQRWDLLDRFQQLQPQMADLDPLGRYQVNLYLQMAREQGGHP